MLSAGFISKWKKAFLSQGIKGLLLKYKGAKPLLNLQAKQAIIEWLKQKDYGLPQFDLQEMGVDNCCITHYYGGISATESSR